MKEVLDLIIKNKSILSKTDKGDDLVYRVSMPNLYHVDVNKFENMSNRYEVVVRIPHRSNAVEIYNIDVDINKKTVKMC